MQVHTFYNGVHPSVLSSLDATSGGTLQNKSPDEAFQLLEEMACNNYQWPTERFYFKKVVGVHEVEPNPTLVAEIANMRQRLDVMSFQGVLKTIYTRTRTILGGGIIPTCLGRVKISKDKDLYLCSRLRSRMHDWRKFLLS